MNANQIFTRVLRYTGILAAVLLILGGIAGYLISGTEGLLSAVIGTGLAVVFSALTAASLIAAIRFDIGGFFGIVMGSWLVKMVVFVVLLVVLRGHPFIEPLTLFVSMVVALVGTTVIDAVVVVRARMPYVSDSVAPVAPSTPSGGTDQV